VPLCICIFFFPPPPFSSSLIVQALGYALTSIPATLFQFLPYLQKYKIQPNRILTLAEQMKCINMVVFSHTCIFVSYI
jgi:methylsterol monooxygenase